MKRKDCLVLPWRTPRVVQKFCLHKTALHSCTSVVIAYCWVLFAIVKITDWNFNKILQSCDVSGCPNGVVACAVLKKQTWLSTGCCKTNPYAGTGLVPCLCASIQNGKKKKKKLRVCLPHPQLGQRSQCALATSATLLLVLVVMQWRLATLGIQGAIWSSVWTTSNLIS